MPSALANLDQAEKDLLQARRDLLRAQNKVARRARTRNAFITVNKLPTELLCAIFLEVVREYTAVRGLSWLPITQVCAHWRRISLNFPTLWTQIVFDCEPSFTRLMLVRSGNAPLDIKITYEHRQSCQLITNLGVHCQRCHTLEINHNVLTSILPQFDHSTTLKTLVIHGPCRGVGIPAALTQSLLRCPALTHLGIRNYGLVWTSIPAIPTLKTLDLTNGDHLYIGNIEEQKAMYDVLSSMPNLEVLRVIDLLPSAFTYLGPPVVLGHLKELEIFNKGAQVSAFFSIISIPSTAIISVWSRTTVMEGTDHISEFLRAFSSAREDDESSSHGVGVQKFKRLQISKLYNGETRTSFWNSHNIESEGKAGLTLTFSHAPASFLLDKYKEAFDLTGLRWLEITDTRWKHLTLGREQWSFFGSLSGLEEIVFTYNGPTNVSTFLEAMVPGDTTESDVPPFPALGELTFDCVTFKEWDTPPISNMLIDAIKARPTNYRLRKVKFKWVESMVAEAVKRLREVVNVDWQER